MVSGVEEQFYLLWPLLLLFLLRTFGKHRFAVPAATFALAAFSSIWMAVLHTMDPAGDPLRNYYGTDTRAAGFLVGSALAMLWSPQRPSRWCSSIVNLTNSSPFCIAAESC